MLAEDMSYDDHFEVRRKCMHGAMAEYHGWVSARHAPSPLPYSCDRYLQQRYEQGYEDGKTALICDTVRKSAH